MLNISDKTKFELKKAGALISLFLGLFFLGFYIVNLLDVRPIVVKTEPAAPISLQANEALKTKADIDGINLADFEQWAKANKLTGNDIYNADPDGDGLPNYLEYIYGTDPSKADTDGDGFSDKQEIINGYDPDAPGDTKPVVYVKIDKIGVDAPMVWSQSDDGDKTLKDLENGLSHFPKTAAPGQDGNTIISGHSSNYLWAKGDFNHVFENLQSLEKGDIVNIKTIQQNGKVIIYKYQISDKFVTLPDDPKIFANTDTSTLTLTTCWPVGTALKRTIIKAELIK